MIPMANQQGIEDEINVNESPLKMNDNHTASSPYHFSDTRVNFLD